MGRVQLERKGNLTSRQPERAVSLTTDLKSGIEASFIAIYNLEILLESIISVRKWESAIGLHDSYGCDENQEKEDNKTGEEYLDEWRSPSDTTHTAIKGAGE